MKTSETLLVCVLAGAIAGAAAGVATGLFRDDGARSDARVPSGEAPRDVAPAASDTSAELARTLDDLRLSNIALGERLAEIEGRLAAADTRTPAELSLEPAGLAHADSTDDAAAPLDDGSAPTPAFVASVSRALDDIRAREEAEREAKRKEQRAQRIEERLTALQGELGLSNGQVSDMRSALLTREEKRDSFFANLEGSDSPPDRRTMGDEMQKIRDETYARLETILTPQQMEGFRATEEREFRRWDERRPGGGGGPGDVPRRDGEGRGR